MKTSLLPSTLIFFLSIAFLNAIPTSMQIETPSGRLVPHNLISSFLPDVPVHTHHERLHEVTSDLKLFSHNSATDLRDYVGSPKPISHTDATVYVDGQLVSTRSAGYVLEGNGYHVVTNEEGLVLSIQTPGSDLQPVNLDVYPGLFVDVRAGATVEFGDDELSVPDFNNAGVDDGGVPEIADAEPTCHGADALPQYVELAIAIDSARCTASGGAANAETVVRGVVDSGEALYRAKMCIRFRIVVMDIQCNSNTDPYATVVNPLSDFRAIWPTRPAASIKRDVVLYATGTNFLSGVAGQAYVGVTCLQSWSFMWIDLMNGLVFAHEMGHNLNASHTTTGVMKASINLGSDTFFADDSVETIVAFVDAESSRSICIEADAVPVTPTPSGTVSSESSPSVSPSVSPIPSVSSTSLPSVSATASSSATPIPSASSTSSPTVSITPSTSEDPSPSQSLEASSSPTVSSSAPPSPSTSISTSKTPMITHSSSVTPSTSAYPSPSSSVSPSNSLDPSPSSTASASPTTSESSSQTPVPSVIPPASQSPSKSPAPSPTSSPSVQVSPPGERTCDSLLLERESYKCTTIGGVFKISVPVTVGGLSGTLSLNTFIRQNYGFAFDVKAPKFVMVGKKKNKEKVGVSVTNVQILASFSPLTQSDVSSATNTVTSQGSSVIGYFYPGDIIAPLGQSSCCGSEFNVAALITIELTGEGTTVEIEEFVSRRVTLQCVQYSDCSLGFEPMSEDVKCPSCEN